MSLHNYLEKLRAKPVQERKRIAVVATAVGFLIILVIWIVSFNEMNKPADSQVDETSASFDDLKDNFQTGKDSIQNMMEQLPASPTGSPSQTLPAKEAEGATGMDNNAETELPAPSVDSIQNIDNSNVISNPAENNNQNKDSMPQLP